MKMQMIPVMALLIGMMTGLVSQADVVYYTESGFDDGILSINKNGTGNTFIVDFPGNVDPRGLAIHRGGNRMYYSKGGTLYRSRLDGSSEESLLASGGSVPTDVEVVGGMMYWSVDGPVGGIRRSNLDGTGMEILVNQTRLDSMSGVPAGSRADDVSGIEVLGGRVYWGNGTGLNSMPLSGVTQGSDVTNHILLGSGDFHKLGIDSDAGKVYWTNNSGSKVQRANLDGTSIEDLVDRGFGRPFAFLLDVDGGKFYFSDTLGTGGKGEILRANLDGSGLEILHSSSTLFAAYDMEFAPPAGVPEPAGALAPVIALLLLFRRSRRRPLSKP